MVLIIPQINVTITKSHITVSREILNKIAKIANRCTILFEKKPYSVLREFSSKIKKISTRPTLDYGISVPAGINMPGGTFGKTNKRAYWKITL